MLDKRHSNDRWDHACTCPVITWKHKFRLPGAGKFLRMISLSSVPGLTIDYPFHQIPLFTSTHKQARWAALPSEVLTSGKYSWSRRSWFLLSSSRRPPRPDYGPPSFSVCLQMSLVVYNTHRITSTFHILPIQLVVVYLKKEIKECNPCCFLFRLSAIFLVVRRLHHQLCGNFVCVCLQHRPAAANFEGFFCQPGNVIPL